MNPQQPLDHTYLDEIAPQAVKSSPLANKMNKIVLFGFIAILLVLILSGIVGTLSGGKKQSWETLAARLTATSEITASSEGKIKNSQLRSSNSNLKISLTNTQRDLAPLLVRAKVDTKKLSQPVVAAESSKAMLLRLEDARLNAKYDSAYAREMSYQLSNILTLLKQLYASSKNEDSKLFLQTTYNNFEPVQKSLAAFSATNE